MRTLYSKQGMHNTIEKERMVNSPRGGGKSHVEMHAKDMSSHANHVKCKLYNVHPNTLHASYAKPFYRPCKNMEIHVKSFEMLKLCKTVQNACKSMRSMWNACNTMQNI